MSVDYNSTARALALPISPPQSPPPERGGGRPAWSERIASRSWREPPQGGGTLRSQVLQSAHELQERALVIYNKLSLLQKILGLIAFVGVTVVGVLFLVYNERFFSMLIPYAERWRDTRGGWIILWLIIIVAAFPPLIGYSSTLTIAGFVYGFPSGWYIATTATVVGSTCSFLASRTVLSKYVERLVGQDKRFEALALTLQHDGLKILVMIRFCPLPYSLSNAAMSTFPTVHPLSFALATLLSCPKLIIPIFIGSRMASIGEGGEGMPLGTKLLNYFSILFGVALGVTIGFYIYRRTTARAKELEAADVEDARRIAVPPRGASYTDDAGEMDAAALMGDDDISLWENADAENNSYRDDFTDDEDVFATGDGEDGRSRSR